MSQTLKTSHVFELRCGIRTSSQSHKFWILTETNTVLNRKSSVYTFKGSPFKTYLEQVNGNNIDIFKLKLRCITILSYKQNQIKLKEVIYDKFELFLHPSYPSAWSLFLKKLKGNNGGTSTSRSSPDPSVRCSIEWVWSVVQDGIESTSIIWRVKNSSLSFFSLKQTHKGCLLREKIGWVPNRRKLIFQRSLPDEFRHHWWYTGRYSRWTWHWWQ